MHIHLFLGRYFVSPRWFSQVCMVLRCLYGNKVYILKGFLPSFSRTKDCLILITTMTTKTMKKCGNCQLDIRRRSNFAKILVRLCFHVAPLVLILFTSMRKANLSGHKKEIQNYFCLLKRSLIRGEMIENM